MKTWDDVWDESNVVSAKIKELKAKGKKWSDPQIKELIIEKQGIWREARKLFPENFIDV